MGSNSKILAKPQLKPQASDAELDRFIAGAPDAGIGNSPVQPAAQLPAVTAPAGRGRKTPISLTLSPQLLAELDKKRAALGGMSRPALISLAVSKFLAQEG
jgi:hypothetical protein